MLVEVRLKPATAAKLASIVVHAGEALSEEGHGHDVAALKALLVDDDVRSFIGDMAKLHLVPVKR